MSFLSNHLFSYSRHMYLWVLMSNGVTSPFRIFRHKHNLWALDFSCNVSVWCPKIAACYRIPIPSEEDFQPVWYAKFCVGLVLALSWDRRTSCLCCRSDWSWCFVLPSIFFFIEDEDEKFDLFKWCFLHKNFQTETPRSWWKGQHLVSLSVDDIPLIPGIVLK